MPLDLTAPIPNKDIIHLGQHDETNPEGVRHTYGLDIDTQS